MLFRKTILSLITLFMAVSGMPVYAEEAPAPEVTERKDDAAASTETGSVLGIKKLYAEEPETLIIGQRFNIAIKTLAAGTDKDLFDDDFLIQTVQVVDTPPSEGITTKDVSAKNDGSYLVWWNADAKTIYLYSKSGDIVLNPDSFGMFRGCKHLTNLDVSEWDTSQVTDMSEMFSDCWRLTMLDVSGWDTSRATLMHRMFSGCSKLTTLDLSSWDTSGAKTMDSMFSNCSSLTVIYIGRDWNIGNAAPCINMFSGCTKLPNFDSSVVNYTHANALPDGYMFMKNPELRYLEKSSFVLSGTSDYGNSVNMVVSSDKNGRMSFKNLEKGTYTLTEVSPTDGYIKNSEKYTVTVTDSGVSVVSDNPDFYYETEDQKVLFNEPYHSFTIQKTSSVDSTVGVEGADFLLSGVSDYGTEVSQPQTTGKTGVATFDHLEAGSYLLTESKAPEHFALDPISRIVTINKYGLVKIDGLSKAGSSFVWTDIRNADGTITITKNWKDTLTGTAAANRALPIIVISDQRTIPDAVTVTYYAGDGYFGTDQTNKTNAVTYTEKVDKNGSILSVSASKGQEMTPSMTGKMFDAWYLDLVLTNKAPDTIVDYIKVKPNEKELALYAKYKDPPMLTTGVKFNEVIKALAAGASKKYSDWDSSIKAVQVAEAVPSDASTMDVSANGDGSYLAWWDADTSAIKLHSKSGSIVLNPDSSSMFYGCSELATLDVSKWNTSQVTNMYGMFYGCSELTTLGVSNWNTSQVTNMSYMFSDCRSLTTLDLSSWNTGSVTGMGGMFERCSNLTTLDVSNWDTSKVTDMGGMFSDCRSLTSLNISNWDTSKVTYMTGMFFGCSNLTTLDVSKWNTSKVTDMIRMFDGCNSLTSLNVSNWKTGSVMRMYDMFRYCASLATLDVSNWDTSKVTDMNYMFEGCSKLTTLDVSGWDTSKVTNMSFMFSDCRSLTALDLSNWNTSSVTNMSNIFSWCSALTTLDISNWNTSQVTSMQYMFSDCRSLTTLNVSGWDTSQVKLMGGMFLGCTGLTALDVSSWNTSQVTSMQYMFEGCSSLTTIYIGPGWNTDKVTSSDHMFDDCTNLPNYNASVVDKTNANADPDTGYMEMADRFKVPYSVHFDKNAVDASGAMVEEAFAAGEKKALTANSYIRDGFAFLSWNTKADGTGRSFADGATVSYLTAEPSITLYAQWRNPNIAYSHTSNIDDNGTQNSNYGNNWTNANITGTDRGDTSKAHVVTIPGAKKIKVTITYGGEGASWDYACVWEGAHPDYTAANNWSSSISFDNTQKLGGGNHTSASNTKTQIIEGNTVTFGFKSDSSGSGDGYGYYAVVEKAS